MYYLVTVKSPDTEVKVKLFRSRKNAERELARLKKFYDKTHKLVVGSQGYFTEDWSIQLSMTGIAVEETKE